MKITLQSSLLAAAIAAVTSLTPTTANAAGTLYISGNAAADCKGSSGFGAQFFYFANQYVENTTSTGQYTVCSYPVIMDPSQPYVTGGGTGFTIYVGLRNAGTTTADFTCAAVVGSEGIPANFQTTVVKALSLPAGVADHIAFSFTELPIKSQWSHAVVNCLLPPNGRQRFIDVFQPKNF